MVCDTMESGGGLGAMCPNVRPTVRFCRCVCAFDWTALVDARADDDDDDARWMRAWITTAVVAGIARYEAPCAAAAAMKAMKAMS